MLKNARKMVQNGVNYTAIETEMVGMFVGQTAGGAGLALLHKLRPQDEAFDPVKLAVDFLRVSGQPD